MTQLDLPEPDPAAQHHSAQLVDFIRSEIVANGGWLDFARYMQLALYAPGLGYYAAGAQKFGMSGDFVTAPEISPLFAETLAMPVAQCLSHMQQACVLEFGAGSGRLAGHLLLQLEKQHALPERYCIVEISAELKQRQAQTIARIAPLLLPRVTWLDRLPETPVNAVVLANEVLDAMPVQCFVKQNRSFLQLGVQLHNGQLHLHTGNMDVEFHQRIAALEQELAMSWCEGYCSEINFNIQPWLVSLARSLNQGAIYLLDYGYPRSEYYLPERNQGTLMCYYQHRSFDDPLRYPGLQDITAFVDFTSVAEAAQAADMEVDGFTSQGNFLLASGLPDLLQQKLSNNERDNLCWIQQAKTLTLPSEMGERFKVMGLSKNLDITLPGFSLHDMRYRL